MKAGAGSIRRFLAAVAFAAAALAPSACGSSSHPAASNTEHADAATPPDASPPLDANLTDASADALPLPSLDAGTLTLPQVLDFEGGVLSAPKLIAVTFPGDTEAPQLATFTTAVGASTYWKAVTSEYGVGPASAGAILVPDDAPTSVDENNGDTESWLATRFDGTHPEWGTFDPNAVYVVFYPSTTAATPNVGGCGGAYHNVLGVTLAPASEGGAGALAQMIYAVVFRCATSPDVGRPSGTDLTTFMASHEMIEATTDPFGTAFAQTDQDHIAWAYFLGSEVADMCAFRAGAAITPGDVGFAVQRSWSNAAAAAFADPCVPGGASPYAVAAPVSPRAISLSTSAGRVDTQGFTVSVGQSLTIDVGFYGDDEADAWTVTPFTYAMEHAQPEPYLAFSPATLTGRRGDVVPLTITRVAEDTGGYGGDAVKLVSTLGAASTEWYFAVGN